MAKGKKTGGRTKGTPNKVTANVKQAILLAFQGVGGQAAFTKWAKANPTEFYTRVLPRVLPTEIAPVDGTSIAAVVMLPALDQATA